MKFTIIYNKEVIKNDIQKLSKTDKGRIKKTIEEKLFTRPEVFGKPLENSLRGYRALRCGNYRVIFRIEKNMVKIMTIEHRSLVYKISIERLKNQ